jgi:hypothetical protein
VPARIASTPRQNSRTSWNPAVPPPPVPGAAVGNELADGLGDGDTLALGEVVFGAVVLGAVVLGAVVLGVLPEVAALDVPLAEIVGVAGPVPPGENEVGAVDGEPAAQADTDKEASMAKAAPPRTVPKRRRP